VNANPNDPAITKEFMKWINAGGRPNNGLMKRRAEEAKIYFK
jgi:GH24 family phage-related lysozyme (muramidase)